MRSRAPRPLATDRLTLAFRAFRHRNYRLYAGGQMVSLVGTWVQSVAQQWLVYRLTHSTLLLGTVAFAGQVPTFALSPVGGAIADRWDRRTTVIATQATSMVLAIILAALTFARWVTPFHLVVLSALLGAVNAIDMPARQALVVEMVGRDDLPNAVALNSSIFNFARIAGPAVAGVLVAIVGEGWCFLVNAVSFLAVLLGLLFMRLPPRILEVRGAGALEDIVEGFRFTARPGPVRALLLLVAASAFFGFPYQTLMPVFADGILHGGASMLGWLTGSSGVGALAAAFVLAYRSTTKGLPRWIAITTAGFGVFLALFAYSRIPWVSCGLLACVGFAMVSQMASTNTMLQLLSPDAMRGRVLAVYSMAFFGAAPLGAFAAGALAGSAGAPATLAGGGILCVISAMLFSRRRSEFDFAVRGTSSSAPGSEGVR